MAYSDKEYLNSNIKYVNKDFVSMKNSLVEYAKTYFPNTYRDFNETSPGMMLIEMAAYVGDVTNFYIDQQYREMMLPLAQERRNIVNIAKMLGYKVKSSQPAFTILKVSQVVGANTSDINNIVPDWTETTILDKGLQVKSSANSDIIFETLDFVDFQTSGSDAGTYEPEVTGYDDNGVVNEYTLHRNVLSVAGQTKTKSFTVASPTKYLSLTLPGSNIIEILSVVDSNGTKWYEVDYLAQDKVPQETHYTSDNGRTTAYSYFDGSDGTSEVSVPYSLQYITTSKRFVTEIDEVGRTSLIFGNGVLRDGVFTQEDFIDLQQVGMTIPGEQANLNLNIDPLQSDSRITMGETPAHTTLTVTYRSGGGISSNVSSNDITEIVDSNIISGPTSTTYTITNEKPAFGGSNGETTDEIRRNAMSFFATQNRCVTKEDYEARILNMPIKFGDVSKVFVERRNTDELFDAVDASMDANGQITQLEWNMLFADTSDGSQIPTIDMYVLSYDSKKTLQTLPDNDGEPTILHPLKLNIKNYLSNFRLITDSVNIIDGYIINFGVAFEVVAHKSANKADVKLRCINKIMEYFNIDRMQFHQTLYTSDLIYEMMVLDGVRAVNWVELTQDFNNLVRANLNLVNDDDILIYDREYVNGEEASYDSSNDRHNGQYGWRYDFTAFYNSDHQNYVGEGIILPSVTPAVFELKNPKINIRGIVR